MMIVTQPLTREAFAPFGDVIDIPSEAGRTYYEEALGNLRAHARPSQTVTTHEIALRAAINVLPGVVQA